MEAMDSQGKDKAMRSLYGNLLTDDTAVVPPFLRCEGMFWDSQDHQAANIRAWDTTLESREGIDGWHTLIRSIPWPHLCWLIILKMYGTQISTFTPWSHLFQLVAQRCMVLENEPTKSSYSLS